MNPYHDVIILARGAETPTPAPGHGTTTGTTEDTGGGHDDFTPVMPHVGELIAAAVFFFTLFLIVKKFALPKLNATLEARERAIAGQLTQAESTRSEADQVLGDYRAKLADAQSEANRIIEEGRRSAEGIVAEARTRAEAEAQALVSRAQADIQAERDRALGALRSELAGLSIDLASRVVGRSLDSDAQRQLVDTYIDQLSSQS
ncbi:MAG TPA: F0F1 ATP synthase subunit B [Mycobacteriales bacterium]|nr:F0F1 ATP synthase subunit B [Mycobacteriales bacterium]